MAIWSFAQNPLNMSFGYQKYQSLTPGTAEIILSSKSLIDPVERSSFGLNRAVTASVE
jgi:hypothetical protein